MIPSFTPAEHPHQHRHHPAHDPRPRRRASRAAAPRPPSFGETEEEALSEVKVAIGLWLDTAPGEGREIPEPGGRGTRTWT
ncbi:type II toxin-antitoxin system HicB family antitoxin [Methanoculleus sp. 10]|uniref:type II toxin-antitoxin system HicB family antitoxin n=1 Tax=Methanoculleus sp. 10 TaxID=430615 RepID=UPI0026006D14|nr:type II toxin-antitoxin system HicB family antitoxin [Methanoculleus sp. 10]